MVNLKDDEYDSLRVFIKHRHYDQGIKWTNIESEVLNMDDSELNNLINHPYNPWPKSTKDVISELIEEMKREEPPKVIVDNGIIVSEEKTTTWYSYKNKIEKSLPMESVNEIDRSTSVLLNKMDIPSTKPHQPSKSLVIGYVQSGKTANMAGLIAKAASTNKPVNLVIVLSGTIENLRIQTQNRLISDLSGGRPTFEPIEYIGKSKTLTNDALRNKIRDGSLRLLTVCLKNSTRLKNLVKWISDLPEDIRKELNILVIDDEADQASVNTMKYDAGETTEDVEERKAVNRWILKLVFSRDTNGQKYKVPANSINYFAYTATPYACLLSDGRMLSLYPDKCVYVLETSNQYLGPSQLFQEFPNAGYNYSPAVILDSRIDDDIVKMDGPDFESIPDTMKEAIAWFYCCVSIMRSREKNPGARKSPISMIIHTSSITDSHHSIYQSIENYLNTVGKEEWKQFCIDIYRKYSQNSRIDCYGKSVENLTKTNFYDVYPNYPRAILINGENRDVPIFDYPDIDSFESELDELIGLEVGPIEKDGKDKFRFSRKVHICEDNSKISNKSAETYCRVVYPSEDNTRDVPDYTTAFIVVGGNTLSRGLTLEGLVSTYFARNVKQGDTLLQMGRWFGYRIGYELLPRVWISPDIAFSFKETTSADELLRDYIQDLGPSWNPREIAVSIPDRFISGIKSMTARNKRYGATKLKNSFGGVFHTNGDSPISVEGVESNRDTLYKFLEEITPNGESYEMRGRFGEKTRYLWRNVDNSTILNLWLKKYIAGSKVQNDDNALFANWFETKIGKLHKTNVVLVGTSKDITPFIGPCGIEAHPSEWKNTREDIARIAISFGDKDIFVDIDDEELKQIEIRSTLKGTRRSKELRANSSLKDTPLLLIYPVHSGYTNPKTGEERFDDVILWDYLMPGKRESDENVLRVQLEMLEKDAENELEGLGDSE